MPDQAALRPIPTVLISTSAQPAEAAAAYQHGVNSHSHKPTSSFDMNQIAQALRVCFLDSAMK